MGGIVMGTESSSRKLLPRGYYNACLCKKHMLGRLPYRVSDTDLGIEHQNLGLIQLRQN